MNDLIEILKTAAEISAKPYADRSCLGGKMWHLREKALHLAGSEKPHDSDSHKHWLRGLLNDRKIENRLGHAGGKAAAGEDTAKQVRWYLESIIPRQAVKQLDLPEVSAL